MQWNGGDIVLGAIFRAPSSQCHLRRFFPAAAAATVVVSLAIVYVVLALKEIVCVMRKRRIGGYMYIVHAIHRWKSYFRVEQRKFYRVYLKKQASI